ncbi:probable serine/threonine-protein kinase clkA [Hylaeus anthracinus]|uniref:probable serine/threonine-protein kinase clkA n=1 Tax=Hylaeus anthracinus TaxID=313031 RepID=UPI0023B8C766|nr:probable serine/threonine-protein kinase clkA [Hylaeus anthracinus]
MIITGGRFQLVSVLVTLALFVRIKTSTASSDPKLGIPTSTENARDDSEIKKETSNFENQKLVRVPLKFWNPRNRERRSIGTADRTVNENERSRYRSEFDLNAIALNEKSSRDDSVFRNDFEKNNAKFQLARIQAGYNNRKDKERSRNQDLEKYTDTYLTKKTIVRRRADYIVKENSDDSQNQINERYAKRNLAIRNDDYYAQRRSVMERFYARQREIANKYSNKTSTTSEHNDRFDLGMIIRTNNVSSLDKIDNKIDAREYINTTTEPEMHPRRVRTENGQHRNHSQDLGNNEEEYEYYDEYDDEISNSRNNGDTHTENINAAANDTKNNSNTPNDNESNSNTLNDRNATRVADKNNSTNWSNCKAKGVGKLLYQYNTLLRAHKNKADIGVSVDGPFCITCVEVTPSVGTKAIISSEVIRAENGTFQTVKITIRGLQDESLSLTVKIWAVPRTSEGCTGN